MEYAYIMICTLVFSFTLNIIYYLKKHINTKETKIFSLLLGVNFIGLTLEIVCTMIGIGYLPNSLISKIFTKAYLTYLDTFLLLMTLYIYVVCYITSSNEDIKRYSILHKLSYYIYFICLIITWILPIDTHAGYATGLAVSFVYICSTWCIIIWIIPIVKNIKKISVKKFVPFFCFALLISLVTVIQKLNPQITLITTMEFLIIFIMYHTIENPDMKMINEVIDAKEEVDKTNEENSMLIYNIVQNLREEITNIKDINNNITKNNIEETKENIKEETNKMSVIINDAFDLSNSDTDIKVYNTKYNVRLLIKEIEARYKSVITNDIEFIVNVSKSTPEVLFGDSLRLKQIISSIINNSIENTTKGKIEIQVNSTIKGNMCRLFIKILDTGRGMNLEKSSKIFNESKEEVDFNDIDNMNLKLPLVKKLVNYLGGTIMIESTEKEATTLTVVIDQKIDRQLYSDIISSRKNIAIVDDKYKEIESKTKQEFSELNIKSDYYKYGVNILNKIREKEEYDLILINDNIEKVKTEEVIKKIREEEKYTNKLIVVGPKEKEELFVDYKVIYIDNKTKLKDILEMIRKELNK